MKEKSSAHFIVMFNVAFLAGLLPVLFTGASLIPRAPQAGRLEPAQGGELERALAKRTEKWMGDWGFDAQDGGGLFGPRRAAPRSWVMELTERVPGLVHVPSEGQGAARLERGVRT